MVLSACLLSGVLSAESTVAEQAEQIFKERCTACHLDDGHGLKSMKVASIAGLPRWYVAQQLRHFRDGKRGAHVNDVEGKMMQSMTQTLDDKSVAFLGKHIQGMKPLKKRQTIKQGRLTDKLAGIDKDKNPGKYRRVKAKLDQATDRLGVATSEAKNVANQSKQNIKAGSIKNVMSDDRYVTQGERTKEQQEKAGKTVKSAFTPKKINTDIGFEAGEVKSNFFKKKSPMKMSYFKK